MVLLLRRDVAGHISRSGGAHGEGGVSGLPTEPHVRWEEELAILADLRRKQAKSGQKRRIDFAIRTKHGNRISADSGIRAIRLFLQVPRFHLPTTCFFTWRRPSFRSD
jgi:hypothetical protein